MKKALRVFALAGALALTWFSSTASADFPYCADYHGTPCSPFVDGIFACEGFAGEPGTCLCSSKSLWNCYV